MPAAFAARAKQTAHAHPIITVSHRPPHFGPAPFITCLAIKRRWEKMYTVGEKTNLHLFFWGIIVKARANRMQPFLASAVSLGSIV